jgi:hypothetical protein
MQSIRSRWFSHSVRVQMLRRKCGAWPEMAMVESRMGAVAWGLWPTPRFPSHQGRLRRRAPTQPITRPSRLPASGPIDNYPGETLPH